MTKHVHDAYRAACNGTRHLSSAMRTRVIETAILHAANNNCALTVEMLDAQIDAVRNVMSAEEWA